MNVAVSEDQQVVTYQLNDSTFVRNDALFSPTLVQWITGSRDVKTVFVVSRVSLNMAIVTQLGSTDSTSKGTCTIAPVTKQAF